MMLDKAISRVKCDLQNLDCGYIYIWSKQLHSLFHLFQHSYNKILAEFGCRGDRVSPVQFSDCLLMEAQITFGVSPQMRTYTTEELSFHICAFAHLDSNNLEVKMGDHTCFESIKELLSISLSTEQRLFT